MKKNILLIHITFFFFINCIFAQDVINSKHHQLSLSTGLVSHTTKDNILSPLTYAGNNILFDFRYSYFGNVHNHFIKVNFNKPTFESSITKNFYRSANYIDATIGNFEYKYLRKFEINNFNYLIGVSWTNYFNIKEHFFVKNSNEIGLDIFSSLNVAVAINKYYKEKHQFQLHISYPFIAYILGQMYSPKHFDEYFMQQSIKKGAIDDLNNISLWDFFSSGKFLSLDKFIDFKGEIIYQYSLSNNFDFVANYTFRFYQYKKYLKVQHFTNQFLIGLILKL